MSKLIALINYTEKTLTETAREPFFKKIISSTATSLFQRF